MSGYLKQPPGVCYFYVALQGLQELPLGRKIIEERVREVPGGFLVQMEDAQYLISAADIELYQSALKRCPQADNPQWIDAVEVAYNRYLGDHFSANLGAAYFYAPTGLAVRTIGGYSHEVLAAFAKLAPVFWWVPSQKPNEGDDDTSEWWDLVYVKQVISRLKEKLTDNSLILCVGTRSSVRDTEFLVAKHAYWVKSIESLEEEDGLRLVDLRADCQAEKVVPISKLVPYLAFLDGGKFLS